MFEYIKRDISMIISKKSLIVIIPEIISKTSKIYLNFDITCDIMPLKLERK